MASGVSVDPLCASEFNYKFKLSSKKEYNWIMYKLSDDLKKIVIDETGDLNSTYDDLKQKLIDIGAAKSCRYAVYDVEFSIGESKKSKIVFIMWAPDTAAIKQKMIYTSSRDYLKRQIDPITYHQANDVDDLSYESLLETVTRVTKN